MHMDMEGRWMMARNSNIEMLKDDELGNAAWNRDELLAMLSHEICSSTQVILSWVELICLRPASDEMMLRGLETIKRSSRLQSRLIKQLLQLSRRERGDLWFDEQRIALRPILEAAINTMTPLALAKSIKLHAELEPSAAPVFGDAAQLEEVFTNLLSNAIKFTPVGGRIEVRFRCWKGCAQITVSDTGRGISAEFLPHVFDRFRQEKGNPTGHDGLGLGLTIVQYLVERHQGKIYALSSGEGKGATFKVRFPLAPGVTANRSSPKTRTTPAPGKMSG